MIVLMALLFDYTDFEKKTENVVIDFSLLDTNHAHQAGATTLCISFPFLALHCEVQDLQNRLLK